MNNELSGIALTEHEGGALGVISNAGAATAYQVKEWFARSPSGFWSGSAGAVYPMMKRLEERGLLVSQDVSRTARPRREFRLTDAGRAALSAWMLDSAQAADPGYDPLRTRLAFLVQVDRAAGSKLLNEVEAQTREMNAPSEDAHVQAVHESWRKMRLAWIADLKQRFG